MKASKICLLVGACITYGHLGYLNLEDQELVCLYKECLIISQYFGDILSAIQLCIILSELNTKMHYLEGSLIVVFEQIRLDMFVPRSVNLEEIKSIAFSLVAKRFWLLKCLDKAIVYYQKAINISKKLGFKETEEDAYLNLGIVYSEFGKYLESKECFENCIKISKETGNKVCEALGYLHLGSANHHLGKWNELLSCFQESINIALQIDNMEILRAAYSKMGVPFGYFSIVEAPRHLERALKIAKEIGDREAEADLFQLLGIVYQTFGKYQEAMDCCQKGLKISIEIGDKKLEGSSYMYLGDLYWTLGKYHKAIQHLYKGLGVFTSIGNRELEGATYMLLAGVYNSVGKLQDSLENLNKSLAIAIETDNKSGQINCYGHLGIVHQNLKKYEKAMEYCVKCLNSSLEIGNKLSEGKAYCYIGNVHLSSNNIGEAIKYFQKSLSIATSINDKEEEGYVYCRLGLAYAIANEYHEAIAYLEKGLDVAMKIGNKSIAGDASYFLGMAYYDLSVMLGADGDEEKYQEAKQKSEEKLKEALQSREWKFANLRDLNDFKISIVDTFIDTYKVLSKVLIEHQKTDEALLISDRGRARSLGDILVSKYGITEERAPSQTPLDSSGLGSVLSSNQYCILFFAVGDKGFNTWVLTHQQPIVFVSTSNQAVKALQLDFKSNMELNLQQITNCLNEFYFKVPREIVTAASENRSFDSTEDIKPPSVGSEAQLKKAGIKSGERNGDSDGEPQNEDDKTDQLKYLFSLLIAPVMQHLQHEEIVIIPDGPLFMVPFAALRDPSTGEYLSETKSIRILPSLATLKALQCTGEHHSKTGALIVGNPDVGEVMFKGEAKTFDPLPSAEQEADNIANVLNVKPLIGSQATKDMVKQKLREGVAVIHIAAHGDSEHGHIALAPPPRTDTTSIPEEQDYMLTMQEVQEIGVTAQLVVLSCCHSGRGDIKAEGVVGMSRAFLAAGARAVVASLWAVDDYATSRFMASFYASLKMGESASKSLQIAMEDIRDEEGYEDPMFWAPFFLLGDDVTISG